jgi:bile acid:Na+ symporter, BASS family
MQGDIVSSLILPLGLAFIMFGLGIGLTFADFERVFRYPRAFSVGVVCHFFLLPLVGYGIVSYSGITGAMAVGYMLIAACPTGATSNLLTYHARGDVALAVSFTAFAGLVSIVTVPTIVGWSYIKFMGAEQTIAFPYGSVMVQIFLVMGLPVAVGMLVRAKAPAWVARWQPKLSLAGTILFVLIVIAAVAKNWIVFKEHGMELAPMVLTMNLIMMVLGFGLSMLARAPMRQAATVAIESSVQNGALAIVLASSVLGNNEMMLPAAVYSVVMYAGGIAFVFLMRRYLPPLSVAETAAAKAAMH